ncbi:pentatricopeptide repeat-containing protein At3g02490, mitochondrial-like [Salvia miltiorrhiza]|uniref:pentatricopeptide repeat-containing protein At3g02490, mitochondrial-like n=1 Tax=Salvia miltiorrhiza TaxID=226208 RepID=UPI0025AB92A7|nr:pentatricopeptide repeat-containing protein At3g02490, mitochondrial-like [Salvia miltiorrhiza]
MRNQCLRLLLLRCHSPSQPRISQVHHLRSFTSSLLHAPARAPLAIPIPFALRRRFTSSPEFAVAPPKPPSDQATLLAEIFAKPEMSVDEIKSDLDDKNVIMSHDLILNVLKNPDIDPDVAKRIFNWVSGSQSEILSSNSYNLMIGILGANGLVKETWELIDIMKKKGYGVKKGAFLRISERFMKDGASDEVEKLKDLYATGSASRKDNDVAGGDSGGSDCVRVCEIIGKQVWGDDVEKQLKELNVEFSSDLVTRVLGTLEVDPNKALIFFRWIEECGVFEHDQHSYNALARVLGKEDHSQKFWRFVDEMRSEGHEMARETYVSVSQQFLKKKMTEDAVNLYEFAANGGNKPSVEDCTLLLKKIVASKELDMDLFLKVVEVFKANGNSFTDNILDGVVKSLISVGRMNECNRILAAMKEAGYVPSGALQRKVAFKLGRFGETGKALEFVDKMVPSSDYMTWISLVKGFCEEQNLEGASLGVEKMVKKLGASTCGGRPLAFLVGTYCQKNKPLRAYKLLSKMVNEEGLRPWHSTYRTLTRSLLARKHFKEALGVMCMMKNQGYPPDLDSFIPYLAKRGTTEDALTFTQGMMSKRRPATHVFLRLFEAYLSAGRQSEAHDFLAKCPSHIKDHADVLDLFSSKNSGATEKKAAGVAV